MSRPPRPEGVITRGTTAPNRLRRADRWIVSVHGPLLRRAERPLVVDLGFGASPVTTAELFGRLRVVHPRVEVVGIEIDPARVAAAKPREREGLSFRLGGFELPVDRPPTLVRAFNVLRQYGEGEAWAAWERLCAGLAPDGVLVEGTCAETGRRAAWVTLGARDADGTPAAGAGRSTGGGRGPAALRDAGRVQGADAVRDAAAARGTDAVRDAAAARGTDAVRGAGAVRRRDARPGGAEPRTITLAAHLPTLSRPSDLAERLPKTLIHRNVPGERVHELLAAFDRAWAAAAPQSVFGPRQRWVTAVQLLARDHPVLTAPPYGGRARWRLGEVTLPWSAVAPDQISLIPSLRE
ncbi:class I SAM-dependent methyltransferase [Actinoallomurus rhizosphaericola]|uniref:class I SAM-dependent methyltransferase n=1 Tax=Actinoallomurus rhizosphaericola TaxID=2952536 RepID=UPI002091715C|nr:class I SAM-dependent methyltransferase [Actinoallomurus rhizosphaericola]MCO5993219.1 class I SAM-dependent methyltransferase [Actinoallomurus rhizosphaericola]